VDFQSARSVPAPAVAARDALRAGLVRETVGRPLTPSPLPGGHRYRHLVSRMRAAGFIPAGSRFNARDVRVRRLTIPGPDSDDVTSATFGRNCRSPGYRRDKPGGSLSEKVRGGGRAGEQILRRRRVFAKHPAHRQFRRFRPPCRSSVAVTLGWRNRLFLHFRRRSPVDKADKRGKQGIAVIAF